MLPATSSLIDALIVGSGPAGLGAAGSLARGNHSAVVFDSGVYRNALSSHLHMVPTWDHKSAVDFRDAARKELTERYGMIKFAGKAVEEVKQREDGLFVVVDVDGDTHVGRKLILASGCEDILPQIAGFQECWTKRV
jgi:thioredoxin reductase